MQTPQPQDKPHAPQGSTPLRDPVTNIFHDFDLGRLIAQEIRAQTESAAAPLREQLEQLGPNVKSHSTLPSVYIPVALLDCVRIAVDLVQSAYYVEAIDLLRDAAVEKVAQFSQFDPDCLSPVEKLWDRIASYLCHSLRSLALNYVRRYEEARDAATLALQYLTSDDFGFTCRAYALCCLGRYPEALEDARTAFRLNPNNDAAFGNCSSACLGVGLIDEAISTAKTAVKLNRGNTAARFNLLSAYLRKAGLAHLTNLEKTKNASLASVLPTKHRNPHHQRRQSLQAPDELADGALELNVLAAAGPAARAELLRVIREETRGTSADETDLHRISAGELDDDLAASIILSLLSGVNDSMATTHAGSKGGQQMGKGTLAKGRFWARLRSMHPELFERHPVLSKLASQEEADKAERPRYAFEMSESALGAKGDNVSGNRPWSALTSSLQKRAQSGPRQDEPGSTQAPSSSVAAIRAELPEQMSYSQLVEGDSPAQQELRALIKVDTEWVEVADGPTVLATRNAAIQRFSVTNTNDSSSSSASATPAGSSPFPRISSLDLHRTSPGVQIMKEMSSAMGDHGDLTTHGPSIGAQEMLLDSIDDLSNVLALRTAILLETPHEQGWSSQRVNSAGRRSSLSSPQTLRTATTGSGSSGTVSSSTHSQQQPRSYGNVDPDLDPASISPRYAMLLLYHLAVVSASCYEAHLGQLQGRANTASDADRSDVSMALSVFPTVIRTLQHIAEELAGILSPLNNSSSTTSTEGATSGIENMFTSIMKRWTKLTTEQCSTLVEDDNSAHIKSATQWIHALPSALQHQHAALYAYLKRLEELLVSTNPHVRLAAQQQIIAPEIPTLGRGWNAIAAEALQPALLPDALAQEEFSIVLTSISEEFGPLFTQEASQPMASPLPTAEERLMEMRKVESLLETFPSLQQMLGTSGIDLVRVLLQIGGGGMVHPADSQHLQASLSPTASSTPSGPLPDITSATSEGTSPDSKFPAEVVACVASNLGLAQLAYMRSMQCRRILNSLGYDDDGTPLANQENHLAKYQNILANVSRSLKLVRNVIAKLPSTLLPNFGESLPSVLAGLLPRPAPCLPRHLALMPPVVRQLCVFTAHASHQMRLVASYFQLLDQRMECVRQKSGASVAVSRSVTPLPDRPEDSTQTENPGEDSDLALPSSSNSDPVQELNVRAEDLRVALALDSPVGYQAGTPQGQFRMADQFSTLPDMTRIMNYLANLSNFLRFYVSKLVLDPNVLIRRASTHYLPDVYDKVVPTDVLATMTSFAINRVLVSEQKSPGEMGLSDSHDYLTDTAAGILGCAYAEQLLDRTWKDPIRLLESVQRCAVRVGASALAFAQARKISPCALLRQPLSLGILLGTGIASSHDEGSTPSILPFGDLQHCLFINTANATSVDSHLSMPLLQRTLAYFTPSIPLPAHPLRVSLSGQFSMQDRGRNGMEDDASGDIDRTLPANYKLQLLIALAATSSLNAAFEKFTQSPFGEPNQHRGLSTALTPMDPILDSIQLAIQRQPAIGSRIRGLFCPPGADKPMSSPKLSIRMDRAARLAPDHSKVFPYLHPTIHDMLLPRAFNTASGQTWRASPDLWNQMSDMLTLAYKSYGLVQSSLTTSSLSSEAESEAAMGSADASAGAVASSIGNDKDISKVQRTPPLVGRAVASTTLLSSGDSRPTSRAQSSLQRPGSSQAYFPEVQEVLAKLDTQPDGQSLFSRGVREGYIAALRQYPSTWNPSQNSDVSPVGWYAPSAVFAEPDRGPLFSEQLRETAAAMTISKTPTSENLINSGNSTAIYETVLMSQRLAALRPLNSESDVERTLAKAVAADVSGRPAGSSDWNEDPRPSKSSMSWDANVPDNIAYAYQVNAAFTREGSSLQLLSQLHHSVALAARANGTSNATDVDASSRLGPAGAELPIPPSHQDAIDLEQLRLCLEGAFGTLVFLSELRRRVSLSIRAKRRLEKRTRYQSLVQSVNSLLEEALVLGDACLSTSGSKDSWAVPYGPSITVFGLVTHLVTRLNRGSKQVNGLCDALLNCARDNLKSDFLQLLDILEITYEDESRATLSRHVSQTLETLRDTEKRGGQPGLFANDLLQEEIQHIGASASSTKSKLITVISHQQRLRPLIRALRKLAENCESMTETCFTFAFLFRLAEPMIREFVILAIELGLPETLLSVTYECGSQDKAHGTPEHRPVPLTLFEMLDRLFVYESGRSNRPFGWVHLLSDTTKLLQDDHCFYHIGLPSTAFPLMLDVLASLPKLAYNNAQLWRLLRFLRTQARELGLDPLGKFTKEEAFKDRIFGRLPFAPQSSILCTIAGVRETFDILQFQLTADNHVDRFLITARKFATWLTGTYALSAFLSGYVGKEVSPLELVVHVAQACATLCPRYASMSDSIGQLATQALQLIRQENTDVDKWQRLDSLRGHLPRLLEALAWHLNGLVALNSARSTQSMGAIPESAGSAPIIAEMLEWERAFCDSSAPHFSPLLYRAVESHTTDKERQDYQQKQSKGSPRTLNDRTLSLIRSLDLIADACFLTGDPIATAFTDVSPKLSAKSLSLAAGRRSLLARSPSGLAFERTEGFRTQTKLSSQGKGSSLLGSRLKAFTMVCSALSGLLRASDGTVQGPISSRDLFASPKLSPLAPLFAPYILVEQLLPKIAQISGQIVADWTNRKQATENEIAPCASLVSGVALTSLHSALLTMQLSGVRRLAFSTIFQDLTRDAAGFMAAQPLDLERERERERENASALSSLQSSSGRNDPIYAFDIAMAQVANVILPTLSLQDLLGKTTISAADGADAITSPPARQTLWDFDLLSELKVRVQNTLLALSNLTDWSLTNSARAEKLRALVELCDVIDEAGSTQRLTKSGVAQNAASWLSLLADSMTELVQNLNIDTILSQNADVSKSNVASETAASLTCRRPVLSSAMFAASEARQGGVIATDETNALEHAGALAVSLIRTALEASANGDSALLAEALSLAQEAVQQFVLLARVSEQQPVNAGSVVATAKLVKAAAARQVLAIATGGLRRVSSAAAHVIASHTANVVLKSRLLHGRRRRRSMHVDSQFSRIVPYDPQYIKALIDWPKRPDLVQMRGRIIQSYASSKLAFVSSVGVRLSLIDRGSFSSYPVATSQANRAADQQDQQADQLTTNCLLHKLIEASKAAAWPSVSKHLVSANAFQAFLRTPNSALANGLLSLTQHAHVANTLISPQSYCLNTSWQPCAMILSEFTPTLSHIVDCFRSYLFSLHIAESDQSHPMAHWRRMFEPGEFTAKSWEQQYSAALQIMTSESRAYTPRFGRRSSVPKSAPDPPITATVGYGDASNPCKHVLSLLTKARAAVEWEIHMLREALPSSSPRVKNATALYSHYYIARASMAYANYFENSKQRYKPSNDDLPYMSHAATVLLGSESVSSYHASHELAMRLQQLTSNCSEEHDQSIRKFVETLMEVIMSALPSIRQCANNNQDSQAGHVTFPSEFGVNESQTNKLVVDEGDDEAVSEYGANLLESGPLDVLSLGNAQKEDALCDADSSAKPPRIKPLSMDWLQNVLMSGAGNGASAGRAKVRALHELAMWFGSGRRFRTRISNADLGELTQRALLMPMPQSQAQLSSDPREIKPSVSHSAVESKSSVKADDGESQLQRRLTRHLFAIDQQTGEEAIFALFGHSINVLEKGRTPVPRKLEHESHAGAVTTPYYLVKP